MGYIERSLIHEDAYRICSHNERRIVSSSFRNVFIALGNLSGKKMKGRAKNETRIPRAVVKTVTCIPAFLCACAHCGVLTTRNFDRRTLSARRHRVVAAGHLPCTKPWFRNMQNLWAHPTTPSQPYLHSDSHIFFVLGTPRPCVCYILAKHGDSQPQLVCNGEGLVDWAHLSEWRTWRNYFLREQHGDRR